MIEIKNLSYTYMKKTPFEKTALKNISLTINEGDFRKINADSNYCRAD